MFILISQMSNRGAQTLKKSICLLLSQSFSLSCECIYHLHLKLLTCEGALTVVLTLSTLIWISVLHNVTCGNAVLNQCCSQVL